MSCIEHNYITTPIGVPSVINGRINGALFSNRHSYLMATPEMIGDLHWLVWAGRSNTGVSQFSVGQNIIESSGVLENGARIVMLRRATRQWAGYIVVRPDTPGDRLSFTQHMRLLYGIISIDNATAVTAPDELPLPFSIPNPFTYTWVDGANKRFHIDFYAAWLNGDSDSTMPATTIFDGSMTFYSPDPTWYGDEVVVSNQSRYDLTSTLIESISYYGTARAPWVLDIELTSTPSTAELRQISFVDISDGRRVGKIKPAAGVTWTPFNGEPEQHIVLDVENRTLTINGIVLRSMCPLCIQDWVSLYLVPYRTYAIELDMDVGFNQRITTTFTYRPRYAGV